ncbi:MAG: alkaline shock response membrane anchor protein AmaP, partial [Peptococcaceae bacterium]|nr:alkaline shock response membrane anchor protein AmaP [Peptococcaceae bacterium]
MLAYGVGVIIMVMAVWILAIATGWGLPYNLVDQGLAWLRNSPWESVVIAVFLLFIGMLFLVRRTHSGMTVVMASKYGEISITEEALREIVARSCLEHDGVQQVQANIRQRKEGVEIIISSQFSPEVVIPRLSEEMQTKVKEDVEHYTGIRIAEVKVLVRGLQAA